jgi:hypothetical protein
VVAVDWSGRLDDAGGTWMATAEAGVVTDLRPKTRPGVVDHLVAAACDERLVIGFDFCFSFPAWFLDDLGCRPPEVWGLVAERGEEWLATCPPPFWGPAGSRRPTGRTVLRRTEAALVRSGSPAKSVFQIAGAGAVGTGSLRGMPHLRRLEAAGFAIWPFPGFDSGWPRVVEIYPRALTGPVRKSRRADREAYLEPRRARLSGWMLDLACWSEDAFDAAASALVMADHLDELCALRSAVDEVDLAEGRVWLPRGQGAAGGGEA